MEPQNDAAKIQFEFHKTEYVALKNEILTNIRENDLIAYAGIVGAALSATWLVSNAATVPKLFFAVPFAVSLLSFVMFVQKAMSMGEIGRYLRKIESAYADPRVQGWESSANSARLSRWYVPQNLLLALFWVCSLLGWALFFADRMNLIVWPSLG